MALTVTNITWQPSQNVLRVGGSQDIVRGIKIMKS